ncbi:hypothetical protein O181_037584 [Austropuccinia psidii MF-1]|uniref:Reverse transcriptase/retrotransposon-derived protein RNase H-like domain-containing protein n=1 Tax=Austropuccinia psidii MF-1 TaxID=1389203 RepID=A0A9Q3D6N9_9BASI|nr:hypothetical protein [Austropuccinia psidii MF-1]
MEYHNINELLDMDVIRKIGLNEVVEILTPVLITWHDGKSRLCGDFRSLYNYPKAERYPIPRIPHSLDKLAKAKYITKIDFMKGLQQNGVKPNSMKLLRIICHMSIYDYTRMPFGIKNAPAHFQKMMNTIFQEEILVLSKCTPINLKISLKKCNFGQQELLALEHKVSGLSLAIDQNKVAAVLQKPVQKNIKEMQSFLGFPSYYRSHIKSFFHISSSLYKLCSKDVVFKITKERRDAYERIKHEMTKTPVPILPDFELPFRGSPYQRQIVDGEPRGGVICYISRQLKDSEARYGATQTEFLCLVWALEKLHSYLEGAVFEVYIECTALKSLLNIKTTNRHMLR